MKIQNSDLIRGYIALGCAITGGVILHNDGVAAVGFIWCISEIIRYF